MCDELGECKRVMSSPAQQVYARMLSWCPDALPGEMARRAPAREGQKRGMLQQEEALQEG